MSLRHQTQLARVGIYYLIAVTACAVAGAGCPMGGTVLSATYTIPNGGTQNTAVFRLADGIVYSFTLEGNAGTDPDAFLWTEAGTFVEEFRALGSTEFHEGAYATGNYRLEVFNNEATSMTVTVRVQSR